MVVRNFNASTQEAKAKAKAGNSLLFLGQPGLCSEF